jgi:hypothetical protein
MGVIRRFQAPPHDHHHLSPKSPLISLSPPQSSGNPNTRRVIAYALARSGRIIAAIEALDQLLDQLDRADSCQL